MNLAFGSYLTPDQTTTCTPQPPSPSPPEHQSNIGGRGTSGSVTSSPQHQPQGTPLNVFQLPHTTMNEIGESCNLGKAGVTTIRFSMDMTIPSDIPTLPCHCRHLEKEAAFICKKCQLAFPTESNLLGHQRIVCYASQCDSRGAVRLVQQGFECKACNERMSTYNELKNHCSSDQHLGNSRQTTSLRTTLSPTEGLSHEMEDVVNQITALAAQAAQADPTPNRPQQQQQQPTLAGSVTG
ncbi:hypothetical protein B566_EDAN004970 [Ephemera danica]|nr:hypothetical protein B566_EDAN004970 [Ephemera danica]